MHFDLVHALSIFIAYFWQRDKARLALAPRKQRQRMADNRPGNDCRNAEVLIKRRAGEDLKKPQEGERRGKKGKEGERRGKKGKGYAIISIVAQRKRHL